MPTIMHSSQQSRSARMLGPAGLVLLTLATALALASFDSGGPSTPVGIAAIAAVAWHTITGGSLALAYMLGAVGLGRLPLFASARLRASPESLAIQAGLGFAFMLTLSHLLGVLGLLSGESVLPRVVAWGVVASGLALLADQVIRGPLRPERWEVLPRWAMLFGPLIALLLVAASNPPGWLWTTEHGAYDVRSYHLQLAREWAVGPRIWPLHHNVYSYLPSYMEAAYVHLAALMPGSGSINQRILAGEGEWVIACQMLHALAGLIACGFTCRAARLLLDHVGVRTVIPSGVWLLAGCVLLATPWTIVCSTLAYNEAAVLALISVGCVVALDRSLSPSARALLCGALVGVASSAKPTAILLAGPTVGVLLLCSLPSQRWLALALRTVVIGSCAGIAVMVPWLVRNFLESGNPLFPFASKLFGTAHWTIEQVERHARNHHFDGTFAERLTRLFSTTHGVLHAQFGVTVALAGVSALLALVAPASRRWATALITAVIMGIAAWLSLTHLQARFLVPLLPAMCLLIALGLGSVPALGRHADAGVCPPACPKRARALTLLSIAISACATFLVIGAFVVDGRSRPNALLTAGVGSLTGMLFDETLASLAPEQREQAMREIDDPTRFVNLWLRPQDDPSLSLYLLGDGAPLYFVGASGSGASRSSNPSPPVVYHTTWDASPFADAVASAPSEPAKWSAHLVSRGITHVLVNLDEVARLMDESRYYDPRVSAGQVSEWLATQNAGFSIRREWLRRDARGSTLGGTVLLELHPSSSP